MSLFKDLVEAVLERVRAMTRWHGFYLYEIIGSTDDGKRVDLRHVGEAGGLPDLPNVEKRYGLHGVTCEALKGIQVLVGFEGGKQSRPFVAFYFTDLPKHTTIDATDTIQVATTTGPGHVDKRVYVGSYGRQGVARITDEVASGKIEFLPGIGLVQIVYTPQGGTPSIIGSIAATSLVFTPDPVTLGAINIRGKITSGSEMFESQ